jgi:hypothetical protein
MTVAVKADGTAWHPASDDVRRLGVRIETSPTDNFVNLLLERLSAAHVDGGTVYSRIECNGLNCLFEVAFVPTAEATAAASCGVYPSYLRVVGVSDHGLAEARRMIQFRWGAAHDAVFLSDLGPGT